MANSNFVVHNGLTVGPTTIDATSGNITIPVGRHITVGNVMLRDNGNGRLAIRDITDNSDVIVDATVDAGSTTSGNIQIGTNHLESTNANGPISLRPNGTGVLVFAANLISAGKGGASLTIATGLAMPEEYGVTYSNANIILSPGRVGLYNGNVLINQLTPSVSTTTGALQVHGGVGISGNLALGAAIYAGGSTGTSGQFLSSTGSGLNWVTLNANKINQNASNVTVAESYVNVAINGSALASFGAEGLVLGGALIVNGNLTINGNTTTINANNLTVNDSIIYLAEENPADTLDIGFTAHVVNPTLNHVGFVRDATDSTWKLFSNVSTQPGTTVDFTGAIWNTLQTGNHVPGSSNVFTLGSTTAWWAKSFTVAATAQYADLAENYLGDASYAAGTVVEFGGANEVTLCDSDMSSRVAGVVSTNPAYLMNGAQTGENIVAVALTGRVPTKVRGPIRKGDLIVSAGDGHARAETLPQVGTVIGKALEDFDGDAGVIEVVVGKH